jgi:hypothetical protein
MDIDAVITWVDGEDPRHAAERALHSRDSYHPVSTSATRFAHRGELSYCVLSILRFCPFMRNIYIVTDRQDPGFLQDIFAANPEWSNRIKVVDHATLYGEHADLLPVFSSRSIETMLHRIPGMSDCFVYFNDDMFIGQPLQADFFFRFGRPVLRGRFRRDNPVLARLKQLLRRGARRPGFKEAQRKAARLAGFTGNYFVAEHLPYPMRRSTLQSYYMGREDELRLQAGHRFRTEAQISPIGLTNHLELLHKTPVETSTAAGFIKPPKNSRARAKALQTLEKLQAGQLAAICIQSLDQFEDRDRKTVLASLDRWYKPAQSDAVTHPIACQLVCSAKDQPRSA